jgi:hypothetical protein
LDSNFVTAAFLVGRNPEQAASGIQRATLAAPWPARIHHWHCPIFGAIRAFRPDSIAGGSRLVKTTGGGRNDNYDVICQGAVVGRLSYRLPRRKAGNGCGCANGYHEDA